MKSATYGNAKKFNDYDLTTLSFGIGYTSNGGMFYFDKEDFEKIRYGCWYIDSSTGYVRGILPPNKKREYLHRIIANAKTGEIVDHINHKGIDNRKENLRICTKSQNCANMSRRKDNSSGHTGIWFDKARNKWASQICIKGKRINVGRFERFEDAVEARIKAEEQYFEEFSYRNSQNKASTTGNIEMG